MKRLELLIPFSVLLSACGPSQEELAARQIFLMDSVTNATEQRIKREKQIEDSITLIKAEIQAKKYRLIELKGQLAGEESKLSSLQDFHFLRTANEKASQVAEQTKIIEELRIQIKELEESIK